MKMLWPVCGLQDYVYMNIDIIKGFYVGAIDISLMQPNNSGHALMESFHYYIYSALKIHY